MKRGQFSQEQIVSILHQAEKGEQSIQALCKEHSITETTFYRVLPCGWTPGAKPMAA